MQRYNEYYKSIIVICHRNMIGTICFPLKTYIKCCNKISRTLHISLQAHRTYLQDLPDLLSPIVKPSSSIIVLPTPQGGGRSHMGYMAHLHTCETIVVFISVVSYTQLSHCVALGLAEPLSVLSLGVMYILQES